VLALRMDDLSTLGRRELNGEPQAIAVTPGGIAVLPRRGDSVFLLDPELAGPAVAISFAPRVDPRLLKKLPQATARRAWHGQALAVAGDYLLIAHALVNTGLDAPPGGGGYGGAVSEPVNTVVTALPIGPGLTDRPPAHSFGPGSDVTGMVYRDGILTMAVRGTGAVQSAKVDLRPGEISLDFNDWEDSLGHGLSGVALDASGTVRAFAAFDRKLVFAKIADVRARQPKKRQVVQKIISLRDLVVTRTISLGPSRLDAELALGRRLFFATDDDRISMEGLACQSCHPDGREDGLVWQLKGTRRQTPLLAGRVADTAPYTWVGNAPTLEASLRQTVGRIGGAGLGRREIKALARYLREGMRPVTLPAPPADQTLLIARGRAVFDDDEVGCAACHPAESHFADGETHDVDSVSAQERETFLKARVRAKLPTSFDTPSLHRVAVSAPYFHDGSEPTLDGLLSHNHDRMGHTSQLSPQDQAALVAYLKTL
jgi:mono/diheme cytochrome c family protein